MSKSGSSYLSLGGDVRSYFTFVKNEKWGDAPVNQDAYLLSRILLHSDLHLTKGFRFFFQLQTAFSHGRNDLMVTFPAEQNELEVHQVFADIPLLNKSASLILRVGRQEMTFGSVRLVAAREFPNARRAFDGARILFKHKSIHSSVFYTRPILERKWAFDDKILAEGSNFWGIYNTFYNIPFLQNLDVYYLGLEKEKSIWNDAVGRELRSSIGTRIFGKAKNWTYDFEGIYQFGHIGDKIIRGAWSISSNSTLLIAETKLQPKLGLKTELISGDVKSGDNIIQSLNPLFPNGGYFGLPAIIGPVNLFDIHPSIKITPFNKIQLSMDYDFFWRLSENDGIYGAASNLIYQGTGSDKKFIGQQLGLDINYDPNPFTNFLVNPVWFWPGSFIKEKGKGKNIFFLSVVGQIKF
ncbi:alginate export family protein [Pedobacter sp. PLR]|uniref:alginate export family protein n=1 Tax=Pedobacter sp. PLR TaxID=2994465 RepID=UPI00224791DE|nr:alginate export family protein [Pedobacter sp. PLR]MCX2452262.1 alginate export family protein [Pedobacter sp. PLR]